MKVVIERNEAGDYAVGMEREEAQGPEAAKAMDASMPTPDEGEDTEGAGSMMSEAQEESQEYELEPVPDLDAALAKARELLSNPQSTDGGPSPFEQQAEKDFQSGYKGQPGSGGLMME